LILLNVTLPLQSLIENGHYFTTMRSATQLPILLQDPNPKFHSVFGNVSCKPLVLCNWVGYCEQHDELM
jgi:hypothetical protein